MSTTYVSVIVMVLGAVLPRIGVTLGNEELTTFVSVLATVLGGLWIMYKRYRAGGITVAGVRK
jgi:hypothetical protein